MFARRFCQFLIKEHPLLIVEEKCLLTTKRLLHLQEYQSKSILHSGGVNVQKFIVAQNVEEVEEKLQELNAKQYVVKSQILAGGRGKGSFLPSGMKGGIKLTDSKNEAREYTGKMLGNYLITKQTPKSGVLVQKVMICEAVDIITEKYVAFLLDRASNGIMLIASPCGGMDIEEVSRTNPSKVFKFPIDITDGLSLERARDVAIKLEFEEKHREQAAIQISRIYELFVSNDATLFEINPMSETECNRVMCVDAKFQIDDNAKFRHKELFEGDGDHSEEDPVEYEARCHNLNYIKMNGSIACLVNGAGLAMATMDLIHLHGGSPANFLDVGGGVTVGDVYKAMEIILADKQVEVILVNIFGGIVDCIPIAEGLIRAIEAFHFPVPLVVRLEGNHVKLAKRELGDKKYDVIFAKDMNDAAIKAIALVKK